MSNTLQLDKRQRAMLAEMGVRVWTPVEQVEQAEPARVPEIASEIKKSDLAKPQATKPQTTTAYQAATEVIAPVVAKPAVFEVRTQNANQLD